MRPDEQGLPFREYLAIFKRRATLFSFVAAPAVTIGTAIAFGLPAIYESTGTVLVEQQEVPEYMVRSTVTSDPAERIRTITERALSPANLAKMLVAHHLAPEGADDEDLRLAALEVRGNLAITQLESDVLPTIARPDARNGGPQSFAFNITYEDESPQRALDVTNALVSLYLDENRRVRQEVTGQAREFLDQQAQRLKSQIADTEAKLADFKSKHGDSLPELSNLNFQLMDRTERDLDDAEREIRTLREQQTLLASELAQLSPYAVVYDQDGKPVQSAQDRLKTLQRQYMQLSAVYGQDHPDVQRVKREIDGLSKQTGLPGVDKASLQIELAARQDELKTLRQRYSDEHPDVIRVQRIIENLSDAIARAPDEAAAIANAPPPDNPTYIQKQVQAEGNKASLQAALARRDELRQKLADYESRLSAGPEVEREYSSLTRGYQQLLDQFADVEQKQHQAQIAENLESDSKGERFTELNAPLLPEQPSRPNRLVLEFLFVAVALGAGIGAITLRELTDRTVRNARDVSSLLEVPPIAAIPPISNAHDLRARQWRRFMYGALACVWLGVTALSVVWRTL